MRWLVVGGGTAGCVVAARLSDVESNDVTLLEAGEGDGRRQAGSSSLADLELPGVVWPNLGSYLQGRGLGGSSRVNGALLSGDGVDLLPAETVADAELGPLDRALLAAAPDAVHALLARRDGRLVSTTDVFLSPVLERPNLRVRSGADVRTIVATDDRATGVVLADGTTIDADAIVLCAGAVQSPAILMRSGIEAPGLGELSDHPSRVVDVTLGVAAWGSADALVTGAVLRRPGAEVVPLNHVGADVPGRGALVVGALAARRPGRVTIDADGDADVTFGPLGDDDAAALGAAVSLGVDLLDTPPFREVVDGWRISDGTGYYHAAGSCRSVTDSSGAVEGCAGLYVADSSLIDLPASGLYAPTVAVAARLAASLC